MVGVSEQVQFVDGHLAAETSMRRFHLTLPSNSSVDYYPENTVARFTTKLPNNIDLDGEWEVAVSEISVPSRVYNMMEGLCYYDIGIYLSVSYTHLTLPTKRIV